MKQGKNDKQLHIRTSHEMMLALEELYHNGFMRSEFVRKAIWEKIMKVKKVHRMRGGK